MANDRDIASIVDAIVRQCLRLPHDMRLAFILGYSRNLLVDGTPQATILEIERLARERLDIE